MVRGIFTLFEVADMLGLNVTGVLGGLVSALTVIRQSWLTAAQVGDASVSAPSMTNLTKTALVQGILISLNGNGCILPVESTAKRIPCCAVATWRC